MRKMSSGLSRRAALLGALGAAPALALGRAQASGLFAAMGARPCSACVFFAGPGHCKAICGAMPPEGQCPLWTRAG